MVHGVDIDSIKQYGEIPKNKNLFGARREYKLVRGYDVPESLVKLDMDKVGEVLSARFGAKLRTADGKTEGVAFYGSQHIDDINNRLFAIKKDDDYRKGWVIHEFEFSIRKK